MKFTLPRVSFLVDTGSNWLMPLGFMLLFFTENTPLGCFYWGILLYWKLLGWNYCWVLNGYWLNWSLYWLLVEPVLPK